MKYIGCDFHPSFQQIAMLDLETGELVERRLLHGPRRPRFLRGTAGAGGGGHRSQREHHWFERLLARLGHELWMGDATKDPETGRRKQKHDRAGCQLILQADGGEALSPESGFRRWRSETCDSC